MTHSVLMRLCLRGFSTCNLQILPPPLSTTAKLEAKLEFHRAELAAEVNRHARGKAGLDLLMYLRVITCALEQLGGVYLVSDDLGQLEEGLDTSEGALQTTLDERARSAAGWLRNRNADCSPVAGDAAGGMGAGSGTEGSGGSLTKGGGSQVGSALEGANGGPAAPACVGREGPWTESEGDEVVVESGLAGVMGSGSTGAVGTTASNFLSR